MKPSARRRVERQIQAIMERDGDNCSLCRKPFEHNTKTFVGVTAGGDAALVGLCFEAKLKAVVPAGIYANRHSDLFSSIPPREPTPSDLSPEGLTRNVNALQTL